VNFEKVIIQSGSNLGNREAFLREALQSFLSQKEVRGLKASSIYETEPWGNPDQPYFLNQVFCFDYSESPEFLLSVIKKIEAANGRVRDGNRNMPRTLDLDILSFGNRLIRTPELEVPHPRLHLRAFVLEPLSEIAPEYLHPLLKLTPSEMLAHLKKS
jgi:2-amino-4-hydroxy-6-hydroxymethyldihydropteridine diphosphokinase